MPKKNMTTAGREARSLLKRIQLERDISLLAKQHLTQLEYEHLTLAQAAHRLAELVAIEQERK